MKEVKPEVAAVLNVFPILEHIPAWFPGARLKRSALLSRRCITRWVDAPFQHVVKNMVSIRWFSVPRIQCLVPYKAAGTAGPSMLSDILTRIRSLTETEEEATFSTLSTFILAMVLYPNVQKRAQAEIDVTIGSGLARLPEWEDRSRLPFIDAVIKETLRWHPVTPLGIPHATVDDDVYEEYFIPKVGSGMTIVPYDTNRVRVHRALSRDPIKYPNPDEFLPERFLASDKGPLDGPSFAYGFGRRVCVGRYVADATLWAAAVNILAMFRLEPTPGWDPGKEGENVTSQVSLQDYAAA
ncbi:cytochrome P450 [Chiua virens]|nr:cytochrome P450 [Chiua virens]